MNLRYGPLYRGTKQSNRALNSDLVKNLKLQTFKIDGFYVKLFSKDNALKF
jgi:hypothetical protein